MYILAVETTGPHCSAALIDENGSVFMEKSDDRMNHLKVLAPLIKKIMTENNITANHIGAIAASRGPGSFTGIRIGVSTARSLSQMWNVPCIAVPTLYAFGKKYENLMKKAKEEGTNMMVCPIFDARRNQVYGACTAVGEEGFYEAVKSGPYMLVEFLEMILEYINKYDYERKNTELLFVGDGVEKYNEQIADWAKKNSLCVKTENIYQYADFVGVTALEMWKRGEIVGYQEFEPEYMRKAEAQRKLEERLKMEK